ncbi:TPA: DUF1642 domain-containing protein [Streptococcus suis]|nr:DUF1642 domain-containing protein [Streptococcus suis]
MNKQEFEKQAEALYTDVRSFLDNTFELIDKIHEPQTVVLPKEVAEWIEELKKSRSNLAWVWEVYPNEPKIKNWLESNTEKFMMAWLFGFEIEQEKLYTVEIPDPNRPDIATFLYKENGKVFIGTDIFLDEVPNYKWKNEPENQLTESEIKQDFEWAWDAGFAKEVE